MTDQARLENQMTFFFAICLSFGDGTSAIRKRAEETTWRFLESRGHWYPFRPFETFRQSVADGNYRDAALFSSSHHFGLPTR